MCSRAQDCSDLKSKVEESVGNLQTWRSIRLDTQVKNTVDGARSGLQGECSSTVHPKFMISLCSAQLSCETDSMKASIQTS